MKLQPKYFAIIFLAAGMSSACLEPEKTDEELRQEEIDEAFERIRAEAEANGGAAMRVRRGAMARLQIDDRESPLHHAFVEVPVAGLPDDVEAAAISIVSEPNLLVSNEDVVPNGSAARISLVELPDGGPIVPALPLRISLPIAPGSTRPDDEAVMATLNANEGTLVAVDGSKYDNDCIAFFNNTSENVCEPFVIGKTTDLEQPFAAGWKVDYAGGPAEASTFIYKVTQADGETCAGFRGRDLIDDPVVQTTTSEYVDTSIETSGDTYLFGEPPPIQFRLSVGFENPIEYTHKQPGGYGNLPTETTASIPVDAKFGLTCGGTKYLNDGTTAKATLDLRDWNETAKDAWGDRTDRAGKVKIVGEFDYTTAKGDHVQAAFNANLSDFLWVTYP